MGWGKLTHSAKNAIKNPKNLLAVAAAPFTAGASLALLEDNSGNNIIGEVTGENSAKKANEERKKLQAQTNQQSIDLSNTAHQREVADLQAAGLNPVLSAGGSGATTPTLGTAQIETTMPGGYLAQAQTAANIANTYSNAKQLAAQTKAIPSQVSLNNAQTEMNNANAQILKDQHEFYEDTGYWPGAIETSGTNFNILGQGGGHTQSTPIRNPKKGPKNNPIPMQNDNSAKKAGENYEKTKKKEQERIQKLKDMGWHTSMTTHR